MTYFFNLIFSTPLSWWPGV